MRTITTLITLGLLACAAAGCARSSKAAVRTTTTTTTVVSAPATACAVTGGIVRGTLRVIGGPAPGSNRGQAGRVVASDHGLQCATTAKADGSYELHLVPGVYDLRGAPSHVSGGSGCGVGGPVTVTASSPAQSVVVHCDIR